jgi:hypothetical protein
MGRHRGDGLMSTLPTRRGVVAASGAALWTPLNVSPYALWDAEEDTSITLVGSKASAFVDLTANAYSLGQGTDANRPTYSATSFNGRPGLTFDKAGPNFMSRTGLGSLPTGATACEIWIICDQTLAAADTALGVIFDYGSSPNGLRRVERAVVSAVNRARTVIGNGAGSNTVTNSNTAFSGRQAVRARIGAAATQVDVSGTAGASSAVTPNTAAGNILLGRATGGSAPFAGVINAVIVTPALTGDDETAMLAWAAARIA